MINPAQIRELISDTIKKTGEIQKGYDLLVEATMFFESDLINLKDDGKFPCLGFIRIDPEEFIRLLRGYFLYQPKVVSDFKRIAMVDVENAGKDELVDALVYNIRFQILVAYYWYRWKGINKLSCDIGEVVKIYVDNYCSDETLHEGHAAEVFKDFLERTSARPY